LLAGRFQFPFQDAFPNYPPSDTFAEPLGLNNLIDNVWNLRRKQERPFDPLLYLGDDMMHEILLYSVSLWDFAESRAWGTEIIPSNHMGDPLVLMNVSRRWSQFITSSPQLWSHMLIDTDDEDVLECLQLFFLLSRNRRLFIVLHGSGDVSGRIVMDLLGVGDRIDTLVYPANVSRSTLARFQLYLNASHDQLEHVCRWHKLEVQSGMQQYLKHYSFPISTQLLWMGGIFPLPWLVALCHFQSLTFLSVRISLNECLPAHNYRLELPRLEGLRVQTTLASDHQIDTPINMVCPRLKLLDLRYTLELDLENLRKVPATWIRFGEVDALEELQIDLAIHEVTKDRLIDPLAGWLQMPVEDGPRQRQMMKRLQELRLEQRKEELLEQRQEKLQELHILQIQLQIQLQEEKERQEQEEEQQRERRRAQWRAGREQQGWEQEQWQRRQQYLRQWQQQRRQWQQYLRFMLSIYTQWRQWLSLPNYPTHIQQSSLKTTISTRMHQEACKVIRNMVEEALVWSLPQLTELATSKVLPIFPKHLRKLRFHGFPMSGSLPSITLPSLISLEIIADIPDDLLVMAYIRAPQLRVLRVQVEDGPGTLHKHDWGHTTNNLLDHISLRIGIPRDKQGNLILVFHLPRTQSLNVFSPFIPLHLYLAKPAPLLYTLNAGLGIMSGLSGRQVTQLSAMWNEESVTEWINPCGIPSVAKLKTLISLQRIVLSQHPYVLSEQSPADTFFTFLEQNTHTCPQLNSITLAQCPSSWPRFLCQLRKRNREAMLLGKTKCIEEVGFCQPLHATIIKWLVDAIKARVLDVMERPPTREGNAWPLRPLEADRVFRSCYVCHITGMELGCLEYETRDVDCGKERGEGSKIYVR
jgi:hypothetical protein